MLASLSFQFNRRQSYPPENDPQHEGRGERKSISASIVILAGVSALTACGFIQHGDTQVFIGLMGGGVALLGSSIWFRLLRLNDGE